MKKILFVIMVLYIFSCQEKITIPLDKGQILDVIEACVYDNTCFVRLTKSDNDYFGENVFSESVKGAEIILTVDDRDYTLNYVDSVPSNPTLLGGEKAIRSGYYSEEIAYGVNYKITVTTPEGNIYTASDILFPKPVIDSVRSEKNSSDSTYILFFYISNPPSNYEAIETIYKVPKKNNTDEYGWINSNEKLRYPSLITFDSLYDGRDAEFYISYVSKTVDRYRNTLDEITGGFSSSTSSPGNPPTNFKVEKGENEVLGYFAIYNLDSVSVDI